MISVNHGGQVSFPPPTASCQAGNSDLIPDPEARIPGEDQVRHGIEHEVVPVKQLEHDTVASLQLFWRQPGDQDLRQLLWSEILQVGTQLAAQLVAEGRLRDCGVYRILFGRLVFQAVLK